MTKELCVTMIFIASAFALLGLWYLKRFYPDSWTKSRYRTPRGLLEWISYVFGSALFTLMCIDNLAIAFEPLEQIDYAFAQKMESVCLGLVFFCALFVISLFNRPTRLRGMLALGSVSLLAGFLLIVHNAK